MKDQLHSQCYEFGSFRLDARERLLARDGKSVPLTPKAFDLLLALLERHGRLVEKEELFQAVWPDTMVEESNLSSNIALIRKALGDGTNGERYIETVPKRGYRFVAEVRSWQPESLAAPSSEQPQVPVTATRANRWRTVAIVFALASFVGGLVWWFALRQGPKLPLKVTPFTSSPGAKGQPAFSPDGTQLAFAWRGETNGQNHVYLKQIGNETVRQLTGDPAVVTAEYSPVWSPDGRHIAFIKSTKADACWVTLVPSFGGVERRVSEHQFFYAGFLDWSPDGEWIVVEGNSAENKTYRLYLIAVKTGDVRQLTTPPAGSYGDKSPRFSPDGKTIAFARGSALSSTDVYTVPVTGGEPQRLTFSNNSQVQPVWTADGRELLYFGRNSQGQGGLWRIAVTGGEPVRVEGLPRYLGPNLAISKQGDRLAVIENTDNSNIWQIELGTVATPPKQIIYSTNSDHSPQLSPDGRKIVFVSARAGGSDIWVSDNQGKNAVQVTATGSNGSPRWSPDSRQIVYDNSAKGTDIYVVNAEGGPPRRLTDDPAEDMTPSWSQDGKWIYFCSGRSGSLQVWKMPAAGGAAVQITQQGGFDNVESPDGQYLYYLKARSAPGVWRVPVAGGTEEQVFAHPRAGHRRYWAVTAQGIYFITADQPAHPVLEFFNFATLAFTTVTTLAKPIYTTQPGLSVSPDNRTLIWSQLDQQGSDILLLENFR